MTTYGMHQFEPSPPPSFSEYPLPYKTYPLALQFLVPHA